MTSVFWKTNYECWFKNNHILNYLYCRFFFFFSMKKNFMSVRLRGKEKQKKQKVEKLRKCRKSVNQKKKKLLEHKWQKERSVLWLVPSKNLHQRKKEEEEEEKKDKRTNLKVGVPFVVYFGYSTPRVEIRRSYFPVSPSLLIWHVI